MTAPQRIFFRSACLLGATGIALGAFAAHSLESRISPDLLGTFEVGVRYHMYHALALFALTLARGVWTSRLATATASMWLAGVILFSGSLYVYAITQIKWLVFLTPIGGVLFIVGWGLALFLGGKPAVEQP